MATNPISKFKRRLSAAIDWRVKQEFEVERKVIMKISESVTDVSSITGDQIAAITRLVEDLDRRMKILEGKSR